MFLFPWERAQKRKPGPRSLARIIPSPICCCCAGHEGAWLPAILICCDLIASSAGAGGARVVAVGLPELDPAAVSEWEVATGKSGIRISMLSKHLVPRGSVSCCGAVFAAVPGSFHARSLHR